MAQKTKLRILLALAVWICNVSILLAQTPLYTVIKVSGRVYSVSLKRELKNGDGIRKTDVLKFETPNAYLHVVHPESGRKTIRHVQDSAPHEFMQLLDSFLATDKKNLKSRGIGTSSEALAQQLAHDTVLVLGDGHIRLNPNEMPLKKPAGVKVFYSVDGKKIDKVISDSIGFSLAQSMLFSPDLKGPLPSISVYYCDDVTDFLFSPTILMGTFVPVYTDENLLQQEVKSILSAYPPNVASATVMEEVLHFLSNEYDAPIDSNVRSWMEKKIPGALR